MNEVSDIVAEIAAASRGTASHEMAEAAARLDEMMARYGSESMKEETAELDAA